MVILCPVDVPEVVRELRRDKREFKKKKMTLLKGKDREEQVREIPLVESIEGQSIQAHSFFFTVPFRSPSLVFAGYGTKS